MTSVFVVVGDTEYGEGVLISSVHATKEGAQKAIDAIVEDVRGWNPNRDEDEIRADYYIDEWVLLP